MKTVEVQIRLAMLTDGRIDAATLIYFDHLIID
jgi:hypothetical protein